MHMWWLDLGRETWEWLNSVIKEHGKGWNMGTAKLSLHLQNMRMDYCLLPQSTILLSNDVSRCICLFLWGSFHIGRHTHVIFLS